MFELPLACFKIRDAVYDFEERDGLEVYMEFKSIELTTKAIKDTRVELVIKSIEIFYEGNEVILEYHAKNNTAWLRLLSAFLEVVPVERFVCPSSISSISCSGSKTGCSERPGKHILPP